MHVVHCRTTRSGPDLEEALLRLDATLGAISIRFSALKLLDGGGGPVGSRGGIDGPMGSLLKRDSRV